MKDFDLSVKRFDEFADQYAKRYENLEDYTDSIDAFCHLIRTDKPKILELGCGPGNVTKLLKIRFAESQITAIDLAPNMIAIARKHLPDVDFKLMDVRDILSLPEQFDAVMCSFCLPFLSTKDAQKLISDCAELLHQGGVIYICTMEGNESDAGFEATSFSGEAKIYFNYHAQQDIQDAFVTSGFEIQFFKLQDYREMDGRISTSDMIFIGLKSD